MSFDFPPCFPIVWSSHLIFFSFICAMQICHRCRSPHLIHLVSPTLSPKSPSLLRVPFILYNLWAFLERWREQTLAAEIWSPAGRRDHPTCLILRTNLRYTQRWRYHTNLKRSALILKLLSTRRCLCFPLSMVDMSRTLRIVSYHHGDPPWVQDPVVLTTNPPRVQIDSTAMEVGVTKKSGRRVLILVRVLLFELQPAVPQTAQG